MVRANNKDIKKWSQRNWFLKFETFQELNLAYAGQAYYKIQGHYAGVTAASIYGKEKIRSAFLPEEQKIASQLAGILGNDYSDFYVQYFE